MTEAQLQKRKHLLSQITYRAIISWIEGDADMMHRYRLSSTVKKQQPGAAYTPLKIEVK